MRVAAPILFKLERNGIHKFTLKVILATQYKKYYFFTSLCSSVETIRKPTIVFTILVLMKKSYHERLFVATLT